MRKDACYYLDLINVSKGWSDYRIAKEMNVSAGKISNHRNGRAETFDTEFAIEVADLLSIDRMIVISDMEHIRAKSVKAKRYWKKIGAATVTMLISFNFAIYVLVPNTLKCFGELSRYTLCAITGVKIRGFWAFLVFQVFGFSAANCSQFATK